MAAVAADRHGKPFQSNMLSTSKNKDQYSSKKNEFDPSATTNFSNKDTVNSSLSVGQNKKEQNIAYERGRVKRNERGLASKTNISNADDNRNRQLTDRQLDDETSRSFTGKYLRMNNVCKHEPTNEKETLASQNGTLHESQNRTTADQQAIGVDLTNPEHRPPPDSQFYEKTIRYPTSSVDDMYSHQNQASDTRYTVQKNSDTYKGHSGYTQRSRISHSLYCSCDECLGDLPFGAEGEIDDLEDVPAFDDIPYVLFLTSILDKKTILRARRKQEQQLALNSFQEKNEIKNASEKTNKNKNKGFQAKCKEQVCFDKSKSQSDAIQNHSSICESGTDVTAQNGNEAHPVENTSLSDFSDNTTAELVFRFYRAPTRNVNIQELVTQTVRPKSPCGVVNEEEPGRAANTLTAEGCLKEVKEDKNIAKESKKNENLTEKDTEKFIRQKRLENLNFRASVVKNKTVTSDSIRIPDNRDVAVNVDKVNKPVKSTAFRSKIPLFPKEETPEQKGAHNAEDTVHKFEDTCIDSANQDTFCGVDRTKLSGSPDSNSGAAAACGAKEDQNFGQNRDTSAGNRNETAEKKTESIGHFKKQSSTGIDKVPSTMKLLKMKEPKEQVMQSNVRKTRLSGNSDDEEKEPVAMRLLRQARESKEMHSAFHRDMSGRKAPLLALFFDFNSKDKSSENYTTKNKKMLADRPVNAADKPKQRNKNKNSNPLKQAITGAIAKETLMEQFDVNKNTEEKQADAGKQLPLVTKIKEQILTPESEAFNQIAINRHKTFQRLKMSESVERLKCTCKLCSCL